MELNVIFFVIAFLIAIVFIFFKLKDVKHKFLIFLMIFLILFSFISFNLAFSGKEIPVKNLSDLGNIVKVYFSWLGSAFNNVKIITTNAIKMNWQGNKTT